MNPVGPLTEFTRNTAGLLKNTIVKGADAI